MPVMNGLEMTRQIFELYEKERNLLKFKPHVILLSGDSIDRKNEL